MCGEDNAITSRNCYCQQCLLVHYKMLAWYAG